MSRPDSPYWFPAKRYGWGWGAPSAWQGWLALIVFVALLGAAALLFPPTARPVAFVVSTLVLCALLTGVCLAKGEPPSWRWGR